MEMIGDSNRRRAWLIKEVNKLVGNWRKLWAEAGCVRHYICALEQSYETSESKYGVKSYVCSV